MSYTFLPAALLVGSGVLASLPTAAHDNKHRPPPRPPQPLMCSQLAGDAGGLVGAPGIKAVTAVIAPAAGNNVSFCQVDVLYGTSPEQNINVRVGLPLGPLDGGSGGVVGAWNGRTQGIGGGGCAGSLNVNAPVNAGYVGSGNDTGHSGGNCEPGVNADGTYNLQFINDFIRNGMKAQVLLSKRVAATYYAKKPDFNYWNGCSTGGRQGYLVAQELGRELDGILANAPAMYWTRFQTAQMWGQIVMKDLVGGPIAGAKLTQATTSAVAACDGADGVFDGVIDEPRACTFSATANICGAPTAPAANCLNAAEAQAIDRIWDGPRNPDGKRIWFGLDRGTAINALNGTFPFFLGVTQFHWDTHNPTFDWTTVTMNTYADVAQQGSRNIADVTDTFDDLDTFRASGGKLLTMVGANDQLIMPQGVLHYYRQMARRYGGPHDDDFSGVQKFFRLFRAPGVAHCAGGAGPQPQGLFDALVNWVENKVAPNTILAQNASGGVVTRTRPLCPYPQTAIYKGSGSTDDAANFACGGNLETREEVCDSVLVKYKHEVNGPLDYREGGTSRGECRRRGHGHDKDKDD
ncbi:MAG TPA: tannase/feruloyl esterase family alpha/beta hydrolase [Burkholderiaceae bacterium]|nr:tannase/feruloyl esterase family alpha/beta hydrolase [Burkholderiaceae bacterium]